MCGKSFALWCCMLPLIASSSELRPNSTNDDGEKSYSTVRYQLDANTMRNYNGEKNLVWYNLHENFTKNNNVQYRIYKSNNRKDDHLMQHKFQPAHAIAKSHENGSQMPEKSRTNSAQTGDENNFMSQDIHRNMKWPISKKGFTSRDYFENFGTEKNKNHIVRYKMCDNIACIRLCCPFGNHLVNGKCIAGQDKFIFLQNMYGYINDSLQNESKNVDELFLLIVQDPCPLTGKYLLNSYQNMFLVDGSLYLWYYQTIIKSTSYCLATVDENIFAVNVCLESMKKIMNKTTTHNKTAIFSNSTNENLKRIENTNGSTSYDPFKNYNRDDNKNNIAPYNICDNITCIRLCCPFGTRLINGKCIAVQGSFTLLRNIYGYINNSAQKRSKIIIDDSFLLIVNDPCQQTGYWIFNPYYNMFLLNGSLYLPHYKKIVESTSYCLADVGQNNFVVNVCRDIMKTIIKKSINYNSNAIEPISKTKILYLCGQTGIILFSLVIFIVYSMPELRNMHGYILRRYSGSLVIGNTIALVNILIGRDAIEDSICIASALVKYYTFLGSWFWLNVMSFDMWHTFRQFCPLQRNTKQQERKKLIMYSVYAWGIPFLFTVICGIMDFVPGVPINLRPKFNGQCWFYKNILYLLYFHEIVVISIIISICLLVCTARNIAHYKKDIAHLLRDSESRRYNINKQWYVNNIFASMRDNLSY
ncbi:hypothetical protein ACFW04_001358 [Cataglyphis niger]